MNIPLRRRWAFYIAMIGTVAVMAVIGLNATSNYRRPFPGVLVDADGVVSSLGLPSWPGFQEGLAYPDRIVSVAGRDLRDRPGAVRARALDDEVQRVGRTAPSRRASRPRGPRLAIGASASRSSRSRRSPGGSSPG